MIGRLTTLLGGDAVRPARSGENVHGAVPVAVAEPDGPDACAALLAECSREGWCVEVSGGGSGGVAGRAPARIDVLLSTRRMSGIVEYEPDDLTIAVAAGTPVAELRARVAASNQRAPLDPGDARSTVGGVLARAAAGPMRRSWGAPRRQVLGVELVTGDGRVLRVGGRVVKNVAGYDLNKLIVGSAGTLGVITRANLRLLPVPASATTVVLGAGSPDLLLDAARALLDTSVQPAALELVGPPWRLIALYEGADEVVVAGVAAASDAARGAAATLTPEAGALGELAALETESGAVVRVAGLPDRLPHAVDVATEIAGRDGTIAAHAGDGIVRALLPTASMNDVEGLVRRIERARDELEGGTIIVARGTPELMRAVDPWGSPGGVPLELMLALRRQFDPAGILQRGRWLA